MWVVPLCYMKGKEMTDLMDHIAGWHFQKHYQSLPSILYHAQNPTPVKDPQLVLLNAQLAEEMGLRVEALKCKEGTLVFSGNALPQEVNPIAQAYAGHQFGHFTNLGDGRAVLLGEHLSPQGQLFDVQLKGAGPTPYSRQGDGRASLSPMLREYLISEAMHGLGIPTTRSLALVSTGETVYRQTAQRGAVLTRIASSHIRVGTFQYAAAIKTPGVLKALADYTIQRHQPDCLKSKWPYLAFLKDVVDKQAKLIAKWQLVGFIHGVMNTDNMAISGETIDYGPCAFMDHYDPKTVFSSIDVGGRYAFNHQPTMAAWNLARLAETLLPLLHEDHDQAIEMAQGVISTFESKYLTYWQEGMGHKLGLHTTQAKDHQLIEGVLVLLEKYALDYTNFFIALTLGDVTTLPCYHEDDFITWYAMWQDRLKEEKASEEAVRSRMKKVNPSLIPRNYYVEKALREAEQDDFEAFNALLDAIKDPFAYTETHRAYGDENTFKLSRYTTYCGT